MGRFLLGVVFPGDEHANCPFAARFMQHPRLALQVHRFVLAFPQADLDVDIWMELPMGIIIGSHESESRGYVLKLKKSPYGLKQASLNWFEKLKQGLTDRGFSPSAINPCLYLKANMIFDVR